MSISYLTCHTSAYVTPYIDRVYDLKSPLGFLFQGFTDTDLQPSTLGLGFDPSALPPESGFKPIVEQGGGLPTLAFSVLDGVGQPFDDQPQGVDEVWVKCPHSFFPPNITSTTFSL